MNIDFEKSGGLVPAIVQDALTMQVLMLGYMNKEALEKNLAEGKVTFFGRSKTTIVDQG
ncbi:MAG: phosphoribosyl-AMP cyclohydrolase / phosphoribosyl-ATP pyrophosphohydrolase [Bacteroidota bacterium]|jgi:phosphoribosyl-ATP pyrophosphohydrolase/phosphoribosyl-AMP cyclohydrolase|nr:hisI [Dysgonamonadaceae bacterium]MDK2970168.1 phosphoribosyl-AMP cyclohydrolase / phosphoribosyl-ATP pyrophosphohydrolase [Bacteroidota bacterium]MDN5297178.1 phosphoribosyl-AMP cyclohydrolase / phosphoribosyl-ATP pyrophosphohydrolase [Bacteroidota bacterium]